MFVERPVNTNQGPGAANRMLLIAIGNPVAVIYLGLRA